MGFTTTQKNQPNYRDINPSYNQTGQQATYSFWIRIPPLTNDMDVKNQIVFVKGSQNQIIKLKFNEQAGNYITLKIPMRKAIISSQQTVTLNLDDSIQKNRVKYEDLVKLLDAYQTSKDKSPNKTSKYMIFNTAPNLVFEVVQYNLETNQLVIKFVSSKQLPPNSYPQKFNDYKSFFTSQIFTQDIKFHYVSVFDNNPQLKNIPDGKGYYSFEYDFINKQPLLRFGNTRNELILEVDTKFGGTKTMTLLDDTVYPENIAKRLGDGQWHLLTIVYDDRFNQHDNFNKTPHLRIGADIRFYFDGRITKTDASGIFNKNYFKFNEGDIFFFPHQQQLSYRDTSGLPKGAIALTGQDKKEYVLQTISQKFHVEFSNFFYWNYTLNDKEIERLFKKKHDPTSFEEYSKKELQKVYGSISDRQRSIPISDYTKTQI